MKSLFCLSLILMAGCATRFVTVEGLDQNTRFRISNRTGSNLQNVHMDIFVQVYGDPTTYWLKEKRRVLLIDEPIDSQMRFKGGIYAIEVSGHGKGCWIRGNYSGAIEPVSTPTIEPGTQQESPQ
jgi:hypothetical protein